MDTGLPGREKHPQVQTDGTRHRQTHSPFMPLEAAQIGVFALSPFVSHLIANSISPSLKASQAQAEQ